MSQSKNSSKDRKKLIAEKNELQKEIGKPRKKGSPENKDDKKAKIKLGKIKKSLSGM